MTRALRFSDRGVSDLLDIYGEVLEVLNERKVIRSANAPTGDYAEWLVQRALGGELQLSPFRSWDFDDAVIVLFNRRYAVRRATRIKVGELKAAARKTNGSLDIG